MTPTTTFEISSMIILILIIAVLGYLLYVNFQWYKTSHTGSLYRSFNAPSSKSIALTCPTGYHIQTSKVYVGNGPSPNSSNPSECFQNMNSTDPTTAYLCKQPTQVYDNTSKTSSDTTVSSLCDGHNQCTVDSTQVGKIATNAQRQCNASGCDEYVFGTYACVPN